MEVTIRYAKTHLERLLTRVVQGEDVILMKGGRALGKLVALPQTSQPRGSRKLGTAKGDFVVPQKFIRPLPKYVEDNFWK